MASQPDQTRTQELAEILAAGLLRVRALKSSQVSAAVAENSLDFSIAESGDPAPSQTESGR